MMLRAWTKQRLSSAINITTKAATTKKIRGDDRHFQQPLSSLVAASHSSTLAGGSTGRSKSNNVGGMDGSSNKIVTNNNNVFGGMRRHSSTLNLPPPNIGKVLIANRGEIACRVIRTCKSLGIPTVSVYSEADGPNSLHATLADESYQIGYGPSPTESYLLQDEIVDICLKTNTTAIHPGYGFLSENAMFATRVQDEANIKFIGPPPNAITAMGSKSQSKAIMDDAGVPTTPGYYDNNVNSEGDEQDPYELLEKAKQIGFPVLIKAVMGGGGKGMRLVYNEHEFLDSLYSCQRESISSFGDGRVLLEKYLIQPRHVEIQIIADNYGNCISLYERDCSLQRRHQKIIEEAPASDLSPSLRQKLGIMGVKAAQAVGYVNAGTVEFLLDTQTTTTTGGEDNENEEPNFYFCEMNTRLQVEHPITECITGIDLVEWQLRIAAGETLPITNQDDVPSANGHAFEARIYAENPYNNFLPATGTLWHHKPPATPNSVGVPKIDGSSNGLVRVDTGLKEGQEVSVYYDPMICKLVVHDKDRPTALKLLIDSLKKYQIAGVPTNIEFLINCAKHETFQKAGAINTGFLDDFMDEVLPTKTSSSETTKQNPLASIVGVFATMLHLEGRKGIQNLQMERQRRSPWSSLSGSWRMGGSGSTGRTKRIIQLDDGNSQVECISNRDGSYDMRLITTTTSSAEVGKSSENDDDNKGNATTNSVSSSSEWYHIDGTWSSSSNCIMKIMINGTQRMSLTTALHTGDDADDDSNFHICMWPHSSLLDSSDYFWEVNVENPISFRKSIGGDSSSASGTTGSGTIKAPMPGKVSRINYNVGDIVREGDTLLVMEAMKMEHVIKSPISGIVSELYCNELDVVKDGRVLATVVKAVDETNGNDNNSSGDEEVA